MDKCPAWREGNQGFEHFSYDRCYATKEMETCECLGNEVSCDFYPEKRKAATKPKYGEWISVKDRLPGVDQKVLYVPANNPQKVEIGKITAIGRCGGVCFTPCISDHPCNFYAKYWMPLPELPKEDAQDEKV